MTGSWILDKNNLSYWLRQIRKEMDLIAPLREHGDIVLRRLERIHEVALDAPALIPSPKEFLFPQYEPVLEEDGRGRMRDVQDNTPRAIFGVRSCDVSALRLLDRFFLYSSCPDPNYAARRSNTLFISIVCNRPDPTCFCSSLGTGPYLSEGFDIQLTDLGDRYFVQSGTKAGARWCRRFSFLMRRPRRPDHEDQYEVELSSTAMFQKSVSLEVARNAILSDVLPEQFWRSVTERCFECGGCVFECPLCTCYTVTDRAFRGRLERARLWDACLFRGFTYMAGGVYPNQRRELRTKRWYYHKLVHYPDLYGGFGCVGCGRCTITCPGVIDMATVATRIKRYEGQG